jgi:hypothetical protein
MPNSFASVAFLLLSTSALAAPMECPTSDREAVIELIDHSATCQRSLQVFKACASGAGGDIRLGEAVVKRCEQEFLGKLNSARQLIYERKQKECARKFEKQSGTMYRSFEAFCSANVADAYSRRFHKK